LDNYPVTRFQRERRFGGSANPWCIEIEGRTWVRMAELQPCEYGRRPWLPHSGWPIDANEMRPFLRRANAASGAPFDDFAVSAWGGDPWRVVSIRCQPAPSSHSIFRRPLGIRWLTSTVRARCLSCGG